MNQSWMLGVLGAAQQHADRRVERAAGSADLLVVGDRRARRLEVDHEREVGLVVAHAERRRGDERLDLVGLQLRLGVEAHARSRVPPE